MSETVKWKGEIEFAGNVDQFRELAKLLEQLEVKVRIPEWIGRRKHLAGCNPLPITEFLKPDIVKRLTDGAPAFNVNFVKPIPGGIRVPHIHVGPDVMLLGPKQFAEYAGELARAVAQKRVHAIADYPEAMMPIGALDVEK